MGGHARVSGSLSSPCLSCWEHKEPPHPTRTNCLRLDLNPWEPQPPSAHWHQARFLPFLNKQRTQTAGVSCLHPSGTGVCCKFRKGHSVGRWQHGARWPSHRLTDTGLSLRPGGTQAAAPSGCSGSPAPTTLTGAAVLSDQQPGGCGHEAGGLRLTDLSASADGM